MFPLPTLSSQVSIDTPTSLLDRISDALEMTPEEWQDLRAMLLDPFWVMRGA